MLVQNVDDQISIGFSVGISTTVVVRGKDPPLHFFTEALSVSPCTSLLAAVDSQYCESTLLLDALLAFQTKPAAFGKCTLAVISSGPRLVCGRSLIGVVKLGQNAHLTTPSNGLSPGCTNHDVRSSCWELRPTYLHTTSSRHYRDFRSKSGFACLSHSLEHLVAPCR